MHYFFLTANNSIIELLALHITEIIGLTLLCLCGLFPRNFLFKWCRIIFYHPYPKFLKKTFFSFDRTKQPTRCRNIDRMSALIIPFPDPNNQSCKHHRERRGRSYEMPYSLEPSQPHFCSFTLSPESIAAVFLPHLQARHNSSGS